MFEVASQNGGLKNEINQMQATITGLKEELDKTKGRVEDVNSHADFLHGEALDQLKESNEKQASTNADVEKKIKDINKKIRVIENVNKVIQTSVKELRIDHE